MFERTGTCMYGLNCRDIHSGLEEKQAAAKKGGKATGKGKDKKKGKGKKN